MLATFFEITEENITTTIGYVKDFLGDMKPLLLPIIAIGLGLIIFAVIVNTIRGK